MTEPTTALGSVEPPAAGVDPAARVTTWSMWLFVLLPVFDLVLTVVLTLIAVALFRTPDAGSYEVASVLTSDGLSLGLTAVFYVAGVLLAIQDHRILLRRGIPDPLPWTWAFLQTVYLIARGVVLRRCTGHGMLLTWVGLAIAALYLAILYSGLFTGFLLAITS